MAIASNSGTTTTMTSTAAITVGQAYPAQKLPMGTGPRRGRVLPCYKEFAAARHRLAAAADRIGLVKIVDRICERTGSDRPRLPKRRPRGPRHQIRGGQYRMLLPHLAAQLALRIERQWTADCAGQGAHYLPILPRLSGWEDRASRQLHAAFSIDVGAVLLGVGGARQDDIGATST